MLVHRVRTDGGKRAMVATRDIYQSQTVLLKGDNSIDFDLTAFYLDDHPRVELYLYDARFVDTMLFALWISCQQPHKDLSALAPRSHSFPLVLRYKTVLAHLRPKIAQDPLFRENLIVRATNDFTDIKALSLCCAKVHLNVIKYDSAKDDHEHLMLSTHTSLFKHSCYPNAVLKTVIAAVASADDSTDFKIWSVVESLRSIRAGEEITLSYLCDDQLNLPTQARRRELAKIWGVHCICARCCIDVRRR